VLLLKNYIGTIRINSSFNLGNYILQKIGYTLLTLLGVVSVVFFLFNVLPGDPAQMMLGQNENEEQLTIVRKKYGFDLPLSKQYMYYLNDLSPVSMHGNDPSDFAYFSKDKYSGKVLFALGGNKLAIKLPYLRESFQKTGKKVSDIIGETLPNTAVLAVCSIFIALVIGVFLGIVSALKKNSWLDNIIQLVSTFVWNKYTGLPMSGSLYELDDFGEGIHLHLKNLILPAFVLGIRPLAVVTQLMRNSLLEVLTQDYIRTAKAKGLSSMEIIYKHAIKNALNPVVTAISGWFAGMVLVKKL